MACETRWTAGNHPTGDKLLLAHEHQLPRDEAEPILAHLQECWECRAQVERYTRGIDSYIALRKACLDPAATPRPGGRLRLAARLRAADVVESATTRTFWKRVPRSAWVGISAVAAGVLTIAFLLSPAPLTATVMLDRAMQAETMADGRPSAARVRISRDGQQLPADEDSLRRAHIDRAHPLSAASFRTWHNSLHSKDDAVTRTAGEINLETKTADGAIALARLSVAEADFRPRAKHVELRDGITIDVETVDGAAPADQTITAATPHSDQEPAAAVVADSDADASETLEIEVRWALHRIDADLGEPLRIQADGGKLVVTGALDDAARRDQIVEALSGMPRVSTQLTVALADGSALASAQLVEPGETSAPLLSAQLLKDLPDPEARKGFVSAALDVSRKMLRHSWALRRLAERYPSTAESALPPDVQASVQKLAAEHTGAMRSAALQAASLWKPYVQLDLRAPGFRTTWQTASQAALHSAQGFDHLTVRLLAAGANDGLSETEALRRLHETHRQLVAVVARENP